jgi:hypothetical protein
MAPLRRPVLLEATALAVLRPAAVVRVARVLLAILIGVWLALCATGIVVQWQQGPGLDAVGRVTPLHGSHAILGHVVVILILVSLSWAVPLAIERAARTRRLPVAGVHLFLAGAALILVLLSTFTGSLSRPPVSEGSYLRFRVLHTILVPFLGTLALLGWVAVVRSYRKGLSGRGAA